MSPKAHGKASSHTVNRRTFMRQTAAVAAGLAIPTIIPASALGADGHVAPSNRITLAQIGCGAMGRGHTRRLANDLSVEILAVCDVDRKRRGATLDTVSEAYADRSISCTAFNDYQEILSRDDIDAVVIVTPDHWHTPMAMDAANAGKDVYCEKPISITVSEGRQLEQAVSRHGRIFQTGTQYRTNPKIRQVCDFVRGGGLGRVKSVFTLWKRLSTFVVRQERFKPYAKYMDSETIKRSYIPLNFDLPTEPVPEVLDWERWVGPAAWHDYNQLYHTNPSPGVVPWSFQRDFGAGPSTWYHSHAADVIQYALGVERSGPVEFIHPQDGPYPTLTYRYANGTLLHLVEDWEDVKRLYQAVPDTARLGGNFGGLFVGERGWITSMSYGATIEGGPGDMVKTMQASDDGQYDHKDHHANWLDCIRSRQRPHTDAELGHRAAALGHLTIIAYQLGRSLKWDPVKEVFPSDEQANRLLARKKFIHT